MSGDLQDVEAPFPSISADPPKSNESSAQSPIIFHSAAMGHVGVVGKATWTLTGSQAKGSIILEAEWYEEKECGYKRQHGYDEARTTTKHRSRVPDLFRRTSS